MKFLLDAEQDPDVVSGLPDGYSNTTSNTKVIMKKYKTFEWMEKMYQMCLSKVTKFKGLSTFFT